MHSTITKVLPGAFMYLIALNSFGQTRLFNHDWQFVKDVDTLVFPQLFNRTNVVRWSGISLPHTANIEPIEKVTQQWQGTCFYRKFFRLPATDNGKHIAIRFEAAMHEADVYLNGKHVFKHYGGYLPFYVDISDMALFGQENVLLVRLDNRDNAEIPPGKPIKDLDFNYYSGIYRNAWLIIKNKLFITDPVAANTAAGGGVRIHYDSVSRKEAILTVKSQVMNRNNANADARIRITIMDSAGKTQAQALAEPQSVKAAGTATFISKMKLVNPSLWSPESPALYQLRVEVVDKGKVVDSETIATGVRTIRFTDGHLYLNNSRLTIRGTNRHQEYPYLGNALSDNAQFRDAYKIKMAGFNFVRSSHYPQAPSFLDACDQLGILVMDAISGWQFVGNETFMQRSFQEIRDMIRRDRNHPSIIMWEASLNESRMPKAFMQKAHQIVHEELPFDNVYSAGWIDDVFDVFLPARQHGKAPDYWKKYNKNKPFLIAEYGDWEYYAGNAGFNQKDYANLKKEEKSSRQLRGFGEKRLLQQALNFQEAHNDNKYGKAMGDANWLMFDYKRGYAPDIESSGIMDIVRLPKFSFYFYQSQVDPVIGNNPFNKPSLFIADYWHENSDSIIKIFSNCNEVELLVNGKSYSKQAPDTDELSSNLKHPPFTFRVPSFRSGRLTAIGYIQNRKVIEQEQVTPGAANHIRLSVDYSGRKLQVGRNDAVFVYATISDVNGNRVPGSGALVHFKLEGDAEIIGLSSVQAEAGIATILVRAGTKPGRLNITAESAGLKSTRLPVTAEK